MADLTAILHTIIEPTYLQGYLPTWMQTRPSNVLMLTIGLQESRFEHRQQIGGPAHGFWQFERGGGVQGVLTHPASRQYAEKVCEKRRVDATSAAVYEALLADDILGCAFARLLLYTDPAPIPAIGEQQACWNYYVENWRPGRPHPETWPALYAKAVAATAP